MQITAFSFVVKGNNNNKKGKTNYKINGRKPGAKAYSKGRKYAR